LSKHLLDNIKEPPIVNQVQQQPRRDSISGFDQSRQPLNEQLLNQEKKSNIDEDVLLQAQSKIKQLEKELAQSKAHVNNTNTTINTPAKPQENNILTPPPTIMIQPSEENLHSTSNQEGNTTPTTPNTTPTTPSPNSSPNVNNLRRQVSRGSEKRNWLSNITFWSDLP